ncbi:putative transposable element [Pseudoloma neurophilia]|uniref:Putative transposable element n=1 Tax=Pseudoloma neurophilia TaxID=146866 RepID=A0A0R0M1Q5_9MICR|nr:putative transposable element [Pseudoloma neurophilia]
MASNDNNKTSSFNNDMASAAKAFPTFAGIIEQDVSIWTRDCKLIARKQEIDDETTRKVMILTLREKGLSWASHFLETNINTNLNEFISNIESRFSNQASIEQTLQNFLQTKKCKTHTHYIELLKMSTKLLQKNCLNKESVMKLVIARSPSDIKSLLFNILEKDESCETFLKVAEEAT